MRQMTKDGTIFFTIMIVLAIIIGFFMMWAVEGLGDVGTWTFWVEALIVGFITVFSFGLILGCCEPPA